MPDTIHVTILEKDPIRVIALAKQGLSGPQGPIGPEGPAGTPDFVVVETNTDLTTSGQNVIGITDTSAPRTITISSADIVSADRIIAINDQSGGAGTNNITVDTEGLETIDGGASVLIGVNFGSVLFYSNGTNLFTLGTSDLIFSPPPDCGVGTLARCVRHRDDHRFWRCRFSVE